MTGASLSDLHYRLGRFCADATGHVVVNGKRWDASKRQFEGLEIDAHVRSLSCTAQAEVAAHRAENPERMAALDAEWNDRDAALEHARVRYGRGTPQFRAAARAIATREMP